MIFYKDKKKLAAVGMMAILFSVGLLLIAPQKAQAIVPTSDAKVTVSTATIAESTVSLETKDFGLDTVAWAIAKQLLHAISQSIVDWINNGFEGNPLFIEDFEGFMTDQADQATGRFMKEFLSPEVYNAICSPFRPQLYFILKARRTYEDRMRCTLGTVVKNATDFSENLRANGWQSWMSVSLNPQNDPHGALLITLDEQSRRQIEALGGAQIESIFNKGFLSMKKCAEYYDNQWTGEHKCIKYETTSPGAWVSDTLSQATGVDFQTLAMADEIDEIVAALINQLLTGILKK
jgi:hypothetical protein